MKWQPLLPERNFAPDRQRMYRAHVSALQNPKPPATKQAETQTGCALRIIAFIVPGPVNTQSRWAVSGHSGPFRRYTRRPGLLPRPSRAPWNDLRL